MVTFYNSTELPGNSNWIVFFEIPKCLISETFDSKLLPTFVFLMMEILLILVYEVINIVKARWTRKSTREIGK